MCNFIKHSNAALLAEHLDNREFLLGSNFLPYEWRQNMTKVQIESWGTLFLGWGYCGMSHTLVAQLLGLYTYERFFGTFVWNGDDYGIFMATKERSFFWKFPNFDTYESIRIKNMLRTGLYPFSLSDYKRVPEEMVSLGEKLAAQAAQSSTFRVLLPWGEMYSSK